MAESKKATGIPEPLKAKYENIAGMIAQQNEPSNVIPFPLDAVKDDREKGK